MDESPEAKEKRSRVAKACVGCKSSRRKCTGQHPCDHCIKRGIDCIYDEDPPKKRGPKGLGKAVLEAENAALRAELEQIKRLALASGVKLPDGLGAELLGRAVHGHDDDDSDESDADDEAAMKVGMKRKNDIAPGPAGNAGQQQQQHHGYSATAFGQAAGDFQAGATGPMSTLPPPPSGQAAGPATTADVSFSTSAAAPAGAVPGITPDSIWTVGPLVPTDEEEVILRAFFDHCNKMLPAVDEVSFYAALDDAANHVADPEGDGSGGGGTVQAGTSDGSAPNSNNNTNGGEHAGGGGAPVDTGKSNSKKSTSTKSAISKLKKATLSDAPATAAGHPSSGTASTTNAAAAGLTAATSAVANLAQIAYNSEAYGFRVLFHTVLCAGAKVLGRFKVAKKHYELARAYIGPCFSVPSQHLVSALLVMTMITRALCWDPSQSALHAALALRMADLVPVTPEVRIVAVLMQYANCSASLPQPAPPIEVPDEANLDPHRRLADIVGYVLNQLYFKFEAIKTQTEASNFMRLLDQASDIQAETSVLKSFPLRCLSAGMSSILYARFDQPHLAMDKMAQCVRLAKADPLTRFSFPVITCIKDMLPLAKELMSRPEVAAKLAPGGDGTSQSNAIMQLKRDACKFLGSADVEIQYAAGIHQATRIHCGEEGTGTGDGAAGSQQHQRQLGDGVAGGCGSISDSKDGCQCTGVDCTCGKRGAARTANVAPGAEQHASSGGGPCSMSEAKEGPCSAANGSSSSMLAPVIGPDGVRRCPKTGAIIDAGMALSASVMKGPSLPNQTHARVDGRKDCPKALTAAFGHDRETAIRDAAAAGIKPEQQPEPAVAAGPSSDTTSTGNNSDADAGARHVSKMSKTSREARAHVQPQALAKMTATLMPRRAPPQQQQQQQPKARGGRRGGASGANLSDLPAGGTAAEQTHLPGRAAAGSGSGTGMDVDMNVGHVNLELASSDGDSSNDRHEQHATSHYTRPSLVPAPVQLLSRAQSIPGLDSDNGAFGGVGGAFSSNAFGQPSGPFLPQETASQQQHMGMPWQLSGNNTNGALQPWLANSGNNTTAGVQQQQHRYQGGPGASATDSGLIGRGTYGQISLANPHQQQPAIFNGSTYQPSQYGNNNNSSGSMHVKGNSGGSGSGSATPQSTATGASAATHGTTHSMLSSSPVGPTGGMGAPGTVGQQRQQQYQYGHQQHQQSTSGGYGSLVGFNTGLSYDNRYNSIGNVGGGILGTGLSSNWRNDDDYISMVQGAFGDLSADFDRQTLQLHGARSESTGSLSDGSNGSLSGASVGHGHAVGNYNQPGAAGSGMLGSSDDRMLTPTTPSAFLNLPGLNANGSTDNSASMPTLSALVLGAPSSSSAPSSLAAPIGGINSMNARPGALLQHMPSYQGSMAGPQGRGPIAPNGYAGVGNAMQMPSNPMSSQLPSSGISGLVSPPTSSSLLRGISDISGTGMTMMMSGGSNGAASNSLQVQQQYLPLQQQHQQRGLQQNNIANPGLPQVSVLPMAGGDDLDDDDRQSVTSLGYQLDSLLATFPEDADVMM